MVALAWGRSSAVTIKSPPPVLYVPFRSTVPPAQLLYVCVPVVVTVPNVDRVLVLTVNVLKGVVTPTSFNVMLPVEQASSVKLCPPDVRALIAPEKVISPHFIKTY